MGIIRTVPENVKEAAQEAVFRPHRQCTGTVIHIYIGETGPVFQPFGKTTLLVRIFRMLYARHLIVVRRNTRGKMP